MKRLLIFAVLICMLFTACTGTISSDKPEEPTTTEQNVQSVAPGKQQTATDGQNNTEKDPHTDDMSNPGSALQIRGNEEGNILLHFSYGDLEINETLSDEDAQTVRALVINRRESKKEPSCSFSDDVFLELGGVRYEVALDGSGILKNCVTGRYLKLSEKNSKVIADIFAEYGASFPCQ